MQIEFNLNHKTEWGETVILSGQWDDHEVRQLEMVCVANKLWELTLEVPDQAENFYYNYLVKDESEILKSEFGPLRELTRWGDSRQVFDFWRVQTGNSPFETSAFTDSFFKRKKRPGRSKKRQGNLMLSLRYAQVEPDRHIAVIGNQEALGNWDPAKKIRLDESRFPDWTLMLDSGKLDFPLEYKYLLVDSKTDEVVEWEAGENRVIPSLDPTLNTQINDENFIRTLPSWKTAGVAIPVFSLRSEQSFGTGDFMDLKMMVDWVKKTNQSFVQILPINDTILNYSNYDSYPYNAVSVYALHPIYLRLERMGKLKDKKELAYFQKKRTDLNKNSFSDYQNVLNEKWKYFRLIYRQEGAELFETENYREFFVNNREWLLPYAVFSCLRDRYGHPDFGNWPEYSVYKKEEIERLAAPASEIYDEVRFYYYLQYHLHMQLVEVRDYAHSKGIALKSDVPIGVSPRSVDAWVEPHLFNTQMQAGAPPDDFSVTGQNWGFPTYNWEEMAKDDYEWWKKRFRKFVEYFDAYRIDHILGFFRIWEIPGDAVWALTGSFNPSLPFTVGDLQQRGLWWDGDRFLKPYLKEHVIRSIFGKFADDVMREYLDSNGWQSFRFKPEFDTQKKIEAHFATLGYNFTEKELKIRDGLYELHCEVLFVKDKNSDDKVHPRISMQNSYTFRDLDEQTRRTLNAIYVEYYYHRHNEFWKNEALKKLPAIISATNMLVCGEDLGMVPDSVPDVMDQLELLSLEIQRMPKKTNIEFAMPADAPYLSVCTTSTHDMNPIRAWWEEDLTLTQRFYNHALGHPGAAPAECTPALAEEIIDQHLQSKAMLVILPWQDWLAMDKKLRHKNPHAERINVPADPRNFWCYRMHLTLEQLLEENRFNTKVRKMIRNSGR